jgi:polysaccharide export outer membrane protein
MNVKHFFLSLAILLSGCISLFGQTPVKSPPVTNPTANVSATEYIIGPEDILSVSVWREPDLSLREVVVRPDGKISLPLVNDIQANGLTPAQLQDEITGKLKEFVTSPNVTVTVIRIMSQAVSVVGQVARPGTYMLGAQTSVIEILARAGGPSEYAKTKEIKVLRKEEGKTVQFLVNYKEIMKGKNLEQNIVLKKGDVVLVP